LSAAATATVVAVSRSAEHSFSKGCQPEILLLEGLGVADDAHAGVTVQHLSRVARDPNQRNLRQVHLMHEELFEELRAAGFEVAAGQMGENITTGGVDLLGLPTGARLLLGGEALIEITGLRNPCAQLDGLQRGLMAAVLDRDAHGKLIRKAGVMAVVVRGGVVRAGDQITIELPAEPRSSLEPV
jgi:MOSC domain-containing protein YiiM